MPCPEGRRTPDGVPANVDDDGNELVQAVRVLRVSRLRVMDNWSDGQAARQMPATVTPPRRAHAPAWSRTELNSRSSIGKLTL